MRGDIIKNVFKTVIFVTTFSCAERFLGFIYRIFLSRTLGAEGLGIYQISLSILGLFMTISSSGIPITVSRMMIKYKETGQNSRLNSTISAGILYSILLSIPLTLLVYSKSGFVNLLFSDDRCVDVLKIMIPGLTITSIYAVIRGTFWGNKQFVQYSIIEFLEEGVMLVAGIILVNNSVNITDGANKAGLAVLISYVFSFTVSIIIFISSGGKLKSPKTELKPLFNSSVPITAMRTSTSLINTLIAVLLPARLVHYGISSSDAISKFGTVFGMAFPLIFMPSTLIGSLALVLVPELASNYYSKKNLTLKANVEKALKFACIISCLIIPSFLSFGEEFGQIIYSNVLSGNYVKKGAIIMLPMSINMISTSMLNSLNKEKQTLLSFMIGASAMILSIYFLPKYIGIDSLIVGMFFNFTISAIVNLIILSKVSTINLEYKKYFLFASLSIIPSSLFGLVLKITFGNSSIISTIFSIAITGIFSVVINYLLGFFDFIFENKKLNIQIFKKQNSFNRRNYNKQ